MIKATIPETRAITDKDDVKTILRYTKVKMKALGRRAKKEGTSSILQPLKISL